MDESRAGGAEPAARAEAGPRVLILGLDGATFDLLDGWMERGLTPNLKRLVEGGTRAVLRSVMPPTTAPAWASFMTGVGPGQHGVYDFRKRVAGQMKRELVSSRDIQVPTLWDTLAAAGFRAGLINVPVTYPPSPQTSFTISDMLTPSTEVCFTNPPSLYEELRPRLGDYVIDAPAGRLSGQGAVASFFERLEHCTGQRARYALHLLAEYPWDAAMVVFTGTDRLQHALWDVLAGEFVTYRATPEMLGFRERAEQYISRLDEAIGRILDTCPRDTDVFVVSDHGFGPLRRRFKVNQWLARQGLLTPSRRRGALGRLIVSADVLRLRHRLMRLVRRRGRFALKPFWRWVNWSQTRAYVPSITELGIYVNLKGREAEGIVAPGEEYEQIRDGVLQRLQSVRDPDTGEPLVTAAGRREDLYSGAHLEAAPDIVFVLADGACTLDVRLEGKLFERAHWRTGTGAHRFNGVLIGCGPRVRRAQDLGEVEIIDVAPTILHLFGVAIPEHVEGRLLDEMLVPGAAAAAPRAVQPSPMQERPAPAGEAAYSEEEARQVEARLRDIGYL